MRDVTSQCFGGKKKLVREKNDLKFISCTGSETNGGELARIEPMSCEITYLSIALLKSSRGSDEHRFFPN
jgi:hypothetical protein